MTILVRTCAGWFRQQLAGAGGRPAWGEALGLVLLLAAAGSVGWLGTRLGPVGQVVLGGLVVLALAVLLRGGRLKLFGPVLRYELACTARRGRFILVRTVYAAVLFFALWALYFNFTIGANGFGVPQSIDLARFAEGAFYTFMVVQGAAVFLLTPAYTAGTIAGARERKTLDFLLATDLRDREIVIGSLLVRLANLALIILTGLPVLSLIQLWGGVDPNLLLAGFAATGLSVVSLAAAGVLASVYVRRSRDGIVLTYLAAVLYLGLSGLVFLVNDPRVTTFVFTSWPGEVTVQDAIDWLNAGNLPVALVRLQEALDLGTPLAEVLPGLLRDYAVFHLLVAAGCSAWAVARMRALALRLLPSAGNEVKGRSRRRPRVGRRSMVWKELWVEPGLSFNRFGKAVIVLIVLASFVPAVWIVVEHALNGWISYGPPGWGGSRSLDVAVNEWVRITGTLVASLTLLGVAVRAAGCITGERERQTLDGLLTSPLEGGTILLAKWLGSILSVRWAWLWLCLVWALGLAAGALDPAGVPWFLFCWFVYAAFLASLGLWFSVACPTTLRATLWTAGVAALVGGGHLLVWFTCLLPLSPVGQGLGVDLFHLVFTFELFGLTPPAALSWFAFHGQNIELGMIGDWKGNPWEPFLSIVVGLLLWASAAWFLAVRTGRRFRHLANRTALAQPAGPPAPPPAPVDGIPTPAKTAAGPAPARRRSWRKRVAWGTAVLLVVLVPGWWIERTTSASRHLREAIAEADRLDPGWRLEELEAGREVIPVEHNAAVQVLAASGLIPPWPFDPDLGQRIREFEALFKDLAPERQLNARQVAALTENLETCEEALIEARRLKDMPKGRYTIAWSTEFIFTPLGHIDKLQRVCLLLGHNGMLEAHEHQDGDGALASCRAMLNVARSLGDEPLVVSQLVRSASRTDALKQVERVLAQTQPSEAALADLQKLLMDEEKMPFLLTAVRGGRAGLDRFMQWAQNNNLSLIKELPARALPPAEKFRLLLPGSLEEERAAALEFMNRSVELAKQNPEQPAATADYEVRLNDQSPSPLARWVIPSARHFCVLIRRKAALRCAVAMVALERHRRARGEWPKDPEALGKAGYLDRWPADPYDGKPLRLKRLPDGVVIYSIGPDGEDNGGELDRTGQPSKQGTDVGFRLWDVERRRQPAR